MIIRFPTLFALLLLSSSLVGQDLAKSIVTKNKIKKITQTDSSGFVLSYNMFNEAGDIINTVQNQSFLGKEYFKEILYGYKEGKLVNKTTLFMNGKKRYGIDSVYFFYDSLGRLEYVVSCPDNALTFGTLHRYSYVYDKSNGKSQLTQIEYFKDGPLNYSKSKPCTIFFKKNYYLEKFQMFPAGSTVENQNGMKTFLPLDGEDSTIVQQYSLSSIVQIIRLGDSLKITQEINTSYQPESMEHHILTCSEAPYFYYGVSSKEEIKIEKFKAGLLTEMVSTNVNSAPMDRFDFTILFSYLENGLVAEERIIRNYPYAKETENYVIKYRYDYYD